MNIIRIIIHTAKPGLIIGKGGIDIEKLKLVDFIGYSVMNPPMKIQDQFYYIEKLKAKRTLFFKSLIKDLIFINII